MVTDHSEKCIKLESQKYENFKEINLEIDNYKKFRENLINYLNLNPIITFYEFTKKAQTLYDDNGCTFEIKKYISSNIYYNWRKNSNLFTKFSIFNNSVTKENKAYLRDYCFKSVYNKGGKNIFYHEHIIYISNYFIRKIRESHHFYIDGTFVYPKVFSQLIVILYYDSSVKKRFPGIFALINNKKEKGYIELFKSIRNIITLEGNKNLKLN